MKFAAGNAAITLNADENKISALGSVQFVNDTKKTIELTHMSAHVNLFASGQEVGGGYPEDWTIRTIKPGGTYDIEVEFGVSSPVLNVNASGTNEIKIEGKFILETGTETFVLSATLTGKDETVTFKAVE